MDVPVLYKRRVDDNIYAIVKHPDIDSIKVKVEKIVKEAITAGVITLSVTMNLVLAAQALKAYLISRLSQEGVKNINSISLEVKSKSKLYPWKPL
tara:strand:- start:1212 stop:1496 length:285 start_codon:yes stop_codon:yes gene_type:complete